MSSNRTWMEDLKTMVAQKRTSPELRERCIADAKAMGVAKAAEKNNVNPKNIYNWLARSRDKKPPATVGAKQRDYVRLNLEPEKATSTLEVKLCAACKKTLLKSLLASLDL